MKDVNATVLVDLESSEEEIKSNLPRDVQRGIKKANDSELSITEISSKEDKEMNYLYEVYKKTMASGGVKPELLKDLKEKTEKIFICMKDGEIIGGAGIWFINGYDKNIPRLYFATFKEEYKQDYPMNLIYWTCILWAKKQGYKKFDLGGWQINARGHLEGVNNFKQRWGKIVHYKKDYSLIEAIGRKLIRNSRFFNWLNKKIKGRK